MRFKFKVINFSLSPNKRGVFRTFHIQDGALYENSWNLKTIFEKKLHLTCLGGKITDKSEKSEEKLFQENIFGLACVVSRLCFYEIKLYDFIFSRETNACVYSKSI